MQDDITRDKIEKAIKLICQLYRHKIIDTAYIIGSVAKGTAKIESDIDINLVNSSFQEDIELEPSIYEHNIFLEKLGDTEVEKLLKQWETNMELVRILKNIGVEFRRERRKGEVFWYQIYEGELFHILPRKIVNPFIKEGIKITKELC